MILVAIVTRQAGRSGDARLTVLKVSVQVGHPMQRRKSIAMRPPPPRFFHPDRLRPWAGAAKHHIVGAHPPACFDRPVDRTQSNLCIILYAHPDRLDVYQSAAI
jgi:hypothetical protein